MKARILSSFTLFGALIVLLTLNTSGQVVGHGGAFQLSLPAKASVETPSPPEEPASPTTPSDLNRSHQPSAQLSTALTKPPGIDLDVTYISRAPLYNRYDVWYTYDGKPYLRPGSEDHQRWPHRSEVVTFTAHVVNKGTIDSGSFDFGWLIDDSPVYSGTLPGLAPGDEITVTYPWTWAHTVVSECLQGQHTVAFEVDPSDVISETYESNNRLEDRTDALSLVLAVTPDLYEALETPVDPQWPFSAEDWLQKQIAAMNEAFARSVYPSAPDGISERVRLDKILITSSNPPVDYAEDGGFYMTSDDRYGNPFYDPATDVSGALIHELSHQLGIIDIYNLDVALEIPQVRDQNGRPVQMEYWPRMPGLMSNPGYRPPTYSEHTALALNANKGYRRGYYGEYLYDTPEQTYLYVLDNEGDPAPNVTVKLYQRAPSPNTLGSRHGVIDNTPEIVVRTAMSGSLLLPGTALLPNRSVDEPVSTHTGHALRDNPLGVINVTGSNDEFLVEISRGSHQEFLWLDVTRFNLTTWRGATTITITSHAPSDAAPTPPTDLTGIQAYGQVKLQWQPSPSSTVSAYNIYRTSRSASTYTRIVSETTALSHTQPYDNDARAIGFTVTAVDDTGRESGFSDHFWALRLRNPSDVVVDEHDQRIVLDPQNGYALLLQSPGGTYLDTLGSFDTHLEYSRYIAQDSAGRLLISHPGDAYSSRHSVRILGADGAYYYDVGEQGSDPGQFQTPTGVAAWEDAESDTYRILVADSGNHRIQALNDYGGFIDAYESGLDNPQGLALIGDGKLVVADSGNDQLQMLSFDGSDFGFVQIITAALNSPSGLTAYGSDRIIVADTGNHKVKVLDGQGTVLSEHEGPNDGHIGTFNHPRGVATDRYARIIVADTGNGRVVTIQGALPTRPPKNVTIAGPTLGYTQTTYTFTASVSPPTTTLPITYVWQTSGSASGSGTAKWSTVTHTAGLSDTVSFAWVATGTQTITVTAMNAGGSVSDTHSISIGRIRNVYLPLVLRNHPPGPVIQTFSANVDEADPGETITLTWQSSGGTGATLYHLLPSGQFGEFWEVAPSGSMTYDIPPERRNQERFQLFVYDEANHTAQASLSISLTCPDEWFFSPAPDICPSGPPIVTLGAEQHFQHGVMLWVQEEDRIYVLFDDRNQPAWSAFTDEWEPGDPEYDPDIDPPEGYYQPVRGFGLVWREQPGVRDRLGWGIDQEQGYETALQRTSYWKYNETYIQAANDGTWRLGPESSEWEYIPP